MVGYRSMAEMYTEEFAIPRSEYEKLMGDYNLINEQQNQGKLCENKSQ